MEVIITKRARDDLNDYFYHSKSNKKDYINQLIDYTDTISTLPNIGKIVDYIKQYEIRQLIYKKHKILYTIYNNKIYILSFVHTSRKFSIQKNLNLIQFPKNQKSK